MKKFIMFLALTFILLSTGCNESSTTTPTIDGNTLPNGDGNYVSDTAVNESIILPESVTITRLDGNLMTEGMDPADMMSYNACVTDCSLNIPLNDQIAITTCMMGCLDTSGLVNETGAFHVAITLANTGSSSEIVTLKAGAVLDPDSDAYQPMLLIQDIEFTIEAGVTETFLLPVYCLDSSASAPDESNSYTITGLTTTSCLTDILAILATKDVESFTFTHSSTVQSVIWNCTEGNYTAADTADLNDLPDL